MREKDSLPTGTLNPISKSLPQLIEHFDSPFVDRSHDTPRRASTVHTQPAIDLGNFSALNERFPYGPQAMDNPEDGRAMPDSPVCAGLRRLTASAALQWHKSKPRRAGRGSVDSCNEANGRQTPFNL